VDVLPTTPRHAHSRTRQIMRHPFRLLTAAALVAGSLLAATPVLSSHAAPAPNVCQSTSDQPREYHHGSPLTGLVPPNDYYYLSVTTGPGCPVADGGPVHLVATLRVNQVVPAVGAPGAAPDPTRDQMWWALFHLGSGPTGEGFSLTTAPSAVAQNGATVMPCTPPPQFNPQSCLCVFGTQTITMRYDGPDVFGLARGGAAGFRISNMAEDGAIVTDVATLTIVPS